MLKNVCACSNSRFVRPGSRTQSSHSPTHATNRATISLVSTGRKYAPRKLGRRAHFTVAVPVCAFDQTNEDVSPILEMKQTNVDVIARETVIASTK
jgi:hypothetical protein